MRDRKINIPNPQAVSGTNPSVWRWQTISCVTAGMMLMFIGQHVVSRYRAPARQTTGVVKTNAFAPWGTLTETTIMLDRPLAAFERERTTEIRWSFPTTSAAELRNMIHSAGLREKQQARLLDESRWQVVSNAIIVRPPLDLVRDMAAPPRQQIYAILARRSENPSQQFPFVFRGEFKDWVGNCNVSEKVLREMRRMVFKKGDTLVFSDIDYLEMTAPSNEVHDLVRQLSRVPSLLLTLQLDEHSDLPGLMRYWVLPERKLEIEPLLKSLALVHGGASVDVELFIPPLADSLLYSYPHQQAGFPVQPNCVWSSMNFFNAEPDNRFLEERFTGETLNSQYRVVPKADAFGDIVMLYKPAADGGMDMIHMCVHIVDDVVFTKNGGDIYAPWVLMRMPDVAALFAPQPQLQTAVFRRKT
ncbi:MAG TPA: hypothetical protein VGF13_23390 [Verrucomicrobiae bacterium]|jgi:hypothetical protein